MSGRGLRKLLPPALALILSSCAMPGTGAIDAGALQRICTAWPPVSWSARDTPETISDARANNAARAVFCGAGR